MDGWMDGLVACTNTAKEGESYASLVKTALSVCSQVEMFD